MHEPEKLRLRTKKFGLQVLELVRTLPETDEARLIGKQLLRSGMSVAANYRAVGRARSKAEFIAKIGVVVEEADEALFWIEIIRDSGIGRDAGTAPLLREAQELLSIFVASQRTARIREKLSS